MFIKKSRLEETEEELKCRENISPKGYLIWPVTNVSCVWMRGQVDVQPQVIHLVFSSSGSHQCPHFPTRELFGDLVRALLPVATKRLLGIG